jgi:hypothetical protein
MFTKFDLYWIAPTFLLFSCDCNLKRTTLAKSEDASTALAAVDEKPFREPMSLGQELEFEKTHRPSNTVTAEAIFTSLIDAGIVFSNQQQSLGRMQKAAYCANARTDNMYLVVCEYDKLEDVEAGKAVTNSIFKTLPQASQHVNLKTVLSISQLDGKHDSAQRIIDAFSSLKP